MQWIDALERDRNTANCAGNLAALEAFTKEISATIGGKYGVSTRKATPEEQAALIYSIALTRHKFYGKRNMLSEMYEEREVSGLATHHKNHLAAVLGIDTMVAKALNDENFAEQWARVKSATPAAALFIASVKEYAGVNEKASVITTLQEPLTTFLRTNHATISLANEVFNRFNPSILRFCVAPYCGCTIMDLLENQFPDRILMNRYPLQRSGSNKYVVDVVEKDDPSAAERIICTLKETKDGTFHIEQALSFKFKFASMVSRSGFYIFEKPEGGFGIGSNECSSEGSYQQIASEYKPLHPAIVEWEKAYISNGDMIIAKAKGCYWVWSSYFGWVQKLLDWSPLRSGEDVFNRVKAALEQKFGITASEDIELKSEHSDSFIFSTIAVLKSRIGIQKLVWVQQKSDQPVEVRCIGDAEAGTFFFLDEDIASWTSIDGHNHHHGSIVLWRGTDGKINLQRIKIDDSGRYLDPFYPEDIAGDWVMFWQKDRRLELRSKKSDSSIFEHWLYNYSAQDWRKLSDDEREYSADEHHKHIQAKYPDAGLGKCVVDKVTGEFYVLLRDPLNIEQERLVRLTKNPGVPTYTEKTLTVAQADSISLCEPFIQYRGMDGKLYAGMSSVYGFHHHTIPPYPPTITDWDEIEFNKAKRILFAKAVTGYGRNAQYWTLRDTGAWHLLHESLQSGKYLGIYRTDLHKTESVYKFSYSDIGLTLEILNPDTLNFEPTNVTNISTSITRKGRIFSSKDPRIILAVENYKDGVTSWTFCPEANSAQSQYEKIKAKLFQKWKAEAKPFADAPLSVNDLILDDDAQIYGICFSFYQNQMLRGRAKLFEENVFVEWDLPIDEADFSLHPLLQSKSVNVEGHDVPYYYVPPVGVPNGKSVVLMEGGPWSHSEGNYADIIDYYTKHGWSVIIPQESLRTGYGWKHFSKGLGEMGRGNLHQLLHIFYDAQVKGFIPDLNKVSLYGTSYGGFVATSFGLRWEELHAEAGLEKRFNFQAIIADGALLDGILLRPHFLEALVPDDALANAEEYIKRVMPIHRVDMPLSTRLSLVHGKTDVRCSAVHTRIFLKGLKRTGKDVSLFWHTGGHNSPEHKRYPEFIMALMEGALTAQLEREIGLTKE